MARRAYALVPVLVVLAVLSPRVAGADKAAKNEPSPTDRELEITALLALHHFKLTSAQLKKLQEIAAETAGKPRARKPGTASEEYREVQAALRAALVDNVDDEQIDELEERLDGLRDAEQPDLDAEVDVTEAARRRVPEVLRHLTAPQLASYVANNADEIHDPLEQLTAAFVKAGVVTEQTWKKMREEVAGEVGRLVGGINEDRAERVAEQALALLDRARGLSAEQFKKLRPELERKARELAGRADALAVLRHSTEYALAELLSNPQLANALKARLE